MPDTPDSHDLDKLTRWHDGLISESGETGGKFPVCALFLASGDDRRAHDIFRVYRTAFEELGAGFHDLVIFGQHGVSSVSEALVPGLGLAGLRIPALALITRRLLVTHVAENAVTDSVVTFQELHGWSRAFNVIPAPDVQYERVQHCKYNAVVDIRKKWLKSMSKPPYPLQNPNVPNL